MNYGSLNKKPYINTRMFQKKLKLFRIHKFNPFLFCKFLNYLLLLHKSSVRVSWNPDERLYIVSEGDLNIYFARWQRYIQFINGIDYRINRLIKSYNIDFIEINKDDFVIDCGANIGEVGIFLRNSNCKYLPIEPENMEAKCCNINNARWAMKVKEIALWKEKSRITFYSKPDSADSSLFEIKKYEKKQDVEADTLANVLKEFQFKAIKLLKIEAEGAEPEILQGALPILDKVQFIAIDCGYERGVDQLSTFDECNEILQFANFRIIKSDLKRFTFLYEKI